MQRALPIVVALATFAAFAPSIAGGFVNWDDDRNIERNERLHAKDVAWMLTGFHEGHWHPLTWLSLALDHAIWGLRPAGYHLTNVILHAANGAVAYFLIAALLLAAGATDDLRMRLASAAGALLWAVHPLRVESVAWVTERRDVLSGLFMMLSVLMYVRAAKEKRSLWPALSLVFMALSLTAKAWAITLPVVLVVLDVWPLQRISKRALVEKIPYAVLAAAGAVLAVLAQRHNDAMAAFGEHGLAGRAMQATYGLCFYPSRTVIPIRLSPLYLMGGDFTPWRLPFYVSAVVSTGVTVALVVLRHRAPGALAAWLCYAIVVSPVLGIAQSGSQLVADRYSYLSCVPFAVLAAWSSARSRAALAVASIALAAVAPLTVMQVRVWRDSETLWSHAIDCDPRNYVAYDHRGVARFQGGDVAGALGDFDTSIEVEHRWVFAWVHRGVARGRLGHAKGAIADFNQALRRDSRCVDAIVNRGIVYLKTGDPERAIADFETALSWQPRNAEAKRLLEEARKRPRTYK